MQKELEELTFEAIDIADELGLIKKPTFFRRKLAIKHTHGRTSSAYLKYNGALGIRYGKKDWQMNGTGDYVEYKSFHHHPVIGGFKGDEIIHVKRAVVAHELAHAIQFWNKDEGHDKPHGWVWKQLYKALRENWVNPLREGREMLAAGRGE